MKATSAIQTLNLYLAGEEHAFDAYENMNLFEFDNGFFKTPIDCKGDPELAEEIQKLLITLDIPEDKYAKYLESTFTVQGLLKQLAERSKKTNPDANPKLSQLIEKIDNFQLIKTLDFFNTHLQSGGDKEVLLAYMKSYDKNMAKVNKDFYTTTISSDPEVLKAATNILSTLNVPANQWGRYTGTTLTIHDFLQELTEHTKVTDENKSQLAQLKTFVETIETKSKISRQKALLYGVTALFPIIASMPFGGFSVIEQIATAALFTPIVSIVAVAGIGFYKMYQNAMDKNLPFLDKFRENSLILASTALKIAGYGLVIAAAATAAPVAAILTAVAEGVGVVQEGFKLLKMKLQGKTRPPRDGTESLSVKQQDARFDAEYSAKKKKLWVSLGTALALTGLAVVACLFPIAGLVVGGVMGATFAAQWAAEKSIDRSAKKVMQSEFKALEQAYDAKEKELALEHEFSNSANLTERLGVGPGVSKVADHADDISFIEEIDDSEVITQTESGYRSAPFTPPEDAHSEDSQKHMKEVLSHIKQKQDSNEPASGNDASDDDIEEIGPNPYH